jgi:hypothetical protein
MANHWQTACEQLDIMYNMKRSNTMAVKPKKWIQGMHMKKGALHRELKVPEDKKIPKSKLDKAAKSNNPTLAKRANLAKTLSGLRK